MTVAVYPRLGEVLREKNLSVAELGRRIEQRFGLSVDRKTLYRLASSDPIHRADLDIAGAAAAVLGVGLDDVFEVQTAAADAGDESPSPDLDPEQSRRLAELLTRQGERKLTKAERAELESLVAEYGRRLHQYNLRQIAQSRGTSEEQVRREQQGELDRVLAWWREFEASPERRQALTDEVRRRRAMEVAGE
ncbi:MAG: hypothetical protein ACRDI2_14950 [Chloroflexota bacterium]